MREAVRFASGEAKRLVSRGNSPRIRFGDRMVGTNPSAPGEPPKVVTGALRSSISHSVERVPGKIKGKVGVTEGITSRYARALEYGHAGGKIIRPVHAKALRFLPGHAASFVGALRKKFQAEAIEEDVVFVKSVVQGALAPRPFLRPAVLGNRDKIISILLGRGA
ncbi:MAG: hypothetical protein A3E78_14210 [Alphaproteobacteria bacterium RIFCSPHIGHO2_12_FULL_63_12]|nr:MAG: hypothetical protein A3E78_14210 [Alphaproteobacteria bacterium RIFCSPHIGHO2_12_FULL_63_12]